jgi:hypothetical protein
MHRAIKFPTVKAIFETRVIRTKTEPESEVSEWQLVLALGTEDCIRSAPDCRLPFRVLNEVRRALSRLAKRLSLTHKLSDGGRFMPSDIRHGEQDCAALWAFKRASFGSGGVQLLGLLGWTIGKAISVEHCEATNADKFAIFPQGI